MTARGSIVHYTGHRIATRDNAGLHPDAEAAIAQAIAARLDELLPVAAHGSLASGADILCAEALLDHGVRLSAWLPFSADRFKALSVRPAGEQWAVRFDQVLAAANSVIILSEIGVADLAFAHCAQMAMQAAREEAASMRLQAVQLAIWDGRPARGPAGTAVDIAVWQSLGLSTRFVDPCAGRPA